ncbi:hypothetical protein PVAND_011369 [Polypedilum vanderplanki]|uniref:Uncharacterized protein n=1 Tax=Polypedilum vanderplanki TaxID=319348 RepID=A0A9J6CIC3_POLVA|nr:hypothetical protein PVAND_011369 [Polypedilum vanderplanki]
MTAKMCNTINQNIEQCDSKLVDRYIKQFGTLLDNDNSFKSITTPQTSEELNERENVGDYMQPNAVWDRGKQQQEETATDMEYLRRLESSIETYLESLSPLGENQKLSFTSQKLNTLNAYLLNADDAISNDIDLESLGMGSIKLRNNNANSTIKLSNSAIKGNDETETASLSLSNFHNVRDVLQNITQKLDQYLKLNLNESSSSPEQSTTKLKNNIENLKLELDQYVELINQRKEIELRRFSENMFNHHSKLTKVRNAFMKKENNMACISNNDDINIDNNNNNFLYDNAQKSDAVSYYSNDSILDFNKCRRSSHACYGECSSYMSNCCDNGQTTNSVQYYSMLITEDRGELLLNDPPPLLPPRYQEREKISLIYRTSEPHSIIEQWQKYQLNTITIKPKKNKKMVNLNGTREKKNPRPYDIYTFTLDYHKTRLLAMKLEKERKIRFICRLFFYFFGVICFILVVIVVQSMFTMKKK